MLNAVRVGEPKVSWQVGPHGIGIEDDRIEERSEGSSKRGFPCARQSHDENFTHQLSFVLENNNI
jgi:hypothetical protein